jgi:hypothetical protein
MTQTYTIEQINGDNRRPSMPETGYLVRYNPSELYGWLCCKCFVTEAEAVEFTSSL